MALPAGNYISLFAGAAGFDLAVRIAFPGARCVCLVENEINAAAVLAARIKEGCLDDCPIWSDVRSFPGHIFRGNVDLILGGFPCTDLSVAGRQAGIHGEHSGLWFEYLRIIREVQPRWVAIENVPAVIAFPAGGIVLGGLAESGFDAEWLSLRASDVGAAHGRNRVFILAHRTAGGRRVMWQPSGSSRLADGSDGEVVHASRDERDGSHGKAGPRRGVCETGDGVADTGDGQLPEPWWRSEGRDGVGPAVAVLANTERSDRGRQPDTPERRSRGRIVADGNGPAVADTERRSAQRKHESGGAGCRRSEPARGHASVADASGERLPLGDWQRRRATGQPDAESECGGGQNSQPVANADDLGAVRESGIVRSTATATEGARPERERDGDAARYAGDDLADPECAEWWPDFEHDGHTGGRIEASDRSRSDCATLGHTDVARLEGRQQLGRGLPDKWVAGEAGYQGLELFAPGPGATELWRRILASHPYLSPAISTETIERIVCDLDDGLAAVLAGSRTDGLRACGNGIVATQAALALTVLARRLNANQP